MCGIFLVHSKNGTKLSESKCLNASNDLFNRGPDYLKFDFLRKNTLFILNTILSITGETKKNRKLEKSKSNRYSISFNGEIYNYKSLFIRYLKNIKYKENFNDT